MTDRKYRKPRLKKCKKCGTRHSINTKDSWVDPWSGVYYGWCPVARVSYVINYPEDDNVGANSP